MEIMRQPEFCNNCGRSGHSYNHCKSPITSYGLIVARGSERGPELLMIRRRDSLGFMEIMRGKYPLPHKTYILNVLNEMTNDEKQRLKDRSFDELWSELWGDNVGFQYRAEEKTSREKLETLKSGVNVGAECFSLDSLLEETSTNWTETEWGFPKGRRNYQEKDVACALREWEEETGYSRSLVSLVQNILPFDEVFTGSNYKNYKHRYYIGVMDYEASLKDVHFEESEVSKQRWMSIEECMEHIRPYNHERKQIVIDVANSLQQYSLIKSSTIFEPQC